MTIQIRRHRADSEVLRNPLTWIFVGLAGLVAFVTTFSYLGGFLDPDGNARDLPIALVNEDRGTTLAGTPIDFGQQVVRTIKAPNPALGNKVAWTVLPDRSAALRGIARDEYFAALVIPRDFSANLAAIAVPQDGATPRAASIEVLSNPASGSYAGTFSQTVAVQAVESVSEAASKQLTDLLTGTGTRVPASTARALGHPVDATITVAQPIGEHGGRGIAPFYFAVVLSLAGVMGAVIVATGLDFLTGQTSWELLGRRLQRPYQELSSFGAWIRKVVAGLAMAILAGWLVTWMAVGILGMEVESVWQLGFFAMLAVAMSAMATTTLLSLFGIVGELLALFLVVIFGVPSAGGVYPVQALPAFFRFLHGWVPLRFVTDGARALIFFGGADVGLGRAVELLAAYTVGALVVGALVTRGIDARARVRTSLATTQQATHPVGS